MTGEPADNLRLREPEKRIVDRERLVEEKRREARHGLQGARVGRATRSRPNDVVG
jgi:hypothetical protein